MKMTKSTFIIPVISHALRGKKVSLRYQESIWGESNSYVLSAQLVTRETTPHSRKLKDLAITYHLNMSPFAPNLWIFSSRDFPISTGLLNFMVYGVHFGHAIMHVPSCIPSSEIRSTGIVTAFLPCPSEADDQGVVSKSQKFPGYRIFISTKSTVTPWDHNKRERYIYNQLPFAQYLPPQCAHTSNPSKTVLASVFSPTSSRTSLFSMSISSSSSTASPSTVLEHIVHSFVSLGSLIGRNVNAQREKR